MSTKLTARKRYLPRVKAGVTEFKKLSEVDITIAAIAAIAVSNRLIVCRERISVFLNQTPYHSYPPPLLSSKSLDSPLSMAAFQTDSVSFVRAMDLYGVSLRKGETPDEISRTGTGELSAMQ